MVGLKQLYLKLEFLTQPDLVKVDAIVVECFYLIGIITINILLLVGKSFVFLFFIYHDIIVANFILR